MPSELREALTAAGASALIPKIIDPVLFELQRRYSPMVTALPSLKWDSDTYYWNTRNVVANGGFVPDGGARAVSNSTYTQNSAQMKHLQVVGAVTGYSEAVTRQVIGDLRQREIQGSIRGLTWDVETAIMWGNAASTLTNAQPQFDGLDTQVATFSGNGQNAIDQGGNTLTLAMLDELADMVEQNAAMSPFDDSWMFVLSNTAISKIAQLLTNQQRYEKVQVAPGLIVDTYRDIPLVKSHFLSTRGFSVGTLTGATAATGGTLLQNTAYKYKVSAVVARQGEIAASAELSQTTGNTTGTNTITISFSTPSGRDGSQPTLYKVYRTAGGGASNSETFLGYVDATVGFAADGVTPILTTSIVDTGTALIPQNGSTQPGTLPTQYYGTNAGMLPPAVGLENIYLISRDRDNVVRPYVREFTPLDVYPTTASPDSLPYAIISDTCLAVRGSQFTGRAARVAVAV